MHHVKWMSRAPPQTVHTFYDVPLRLSSKVRDINRTFPKHVLYRVPWSRCSAWKFYEILLKFCLMWDLDVLLYRTSKALDNSSFWMCCGPIRSSMRRLDIARIPEVKRCIKRPWSYGNCWSPALAKYWQGLESPIAWNFTVSYHILPPKIPQSAFSQVLPWLNPSWGHRCHIVAVRIIRLTLHLVSPYSSHTALSTTPSFSLCPPSFRPLPLGLKFANICGTSLGIRLFSIFSILQRRMVQWWCNGVAFFIASEVKVWASSVACCWCTWVKTTCSPRMWSPCSQLPTVGHDGPGFSDVDLVAGELPHGWTIYARPPRALYPTIHAYTGSIVHNNKYLYDKMN